VSLTPHQETEKKIIRSKLVREFPGLFSGGSRLEYQQGHSYNFCDVRRRILCYVEMNPGSHLTGTLADRYSDADRR
jgi:hypothetical protein